MPRFRSMLPAAALLGLLVLTACGAHRATTAGDIPGATPAGTPPGLIPGLPAPSALDKQAATYDYERWKTGHSIDLTLPGAKNDAGGIKDPKQASRQTSAYSFDKVTLSPTWDPAVSATPSDMAFVGYTFSHMDTYSGTARLELDWATAPATANLWLGVSDYQKDSWKWFPGTDSGGAVDLGSFAPYLDPQGALHVMVLVLGTSPVTLNYILAGDPLDPQISFYSDLPQNPLQWIAPLTVNFDCTYSFGVGSTIVSFDYDYDGDGVYDVVGDTTGLNQHVYGPGDYTAVLRVTDSLGHSGTQSIPFHIINPNNTAPTALFTPAVSSSTAPFKVDFDASSSSDSDGTITQYEWDFDADGEMDFTSAAPTASYTFALKGDNPVLLKITDSDLATATYSGKVTCTNGWRTSTAATGVGNVYGDISAVVIGNGANARACLAYYDSDDKSLHFVHGSSSSGLTWDAALKAVPGNFNDFEGYSPSLIVENVAQVPAIAFGSYNFNQAVRNLKYVSATSSSGQTWNQPVSVSAEDYLGESNYLSQFNNKLTIATVYKSGYAGKGELLIYQASNANGTAWGAPQTIATAQSASAQFADIRLLPIPAGNPLLVWSSSDNGGFYHAATATTADGGLWGQPFELAGSGTLYATNLGLGFAAGRPALAIGDTGGDGSLYFCRSDNAQGSAWSSAPALVDTGKTDGASCSMATVGGVPAIAYYEGGSSALKYISATAADGSAWNPPMIVDSAGYVGQELALVALPGSIPLVMYSDDTNKKIKAAAFF